MEGGGRQTAKFQRAAHGHNEAMSCIPTKLCKKGTVGINSTEDSWPVGLANDALNGFGPITVCLRPAEWGLNMPRLHNDNASDKLTHLHDLSVCSHTGRQALLFLNCRKKDQPGCP